MYGKLNSKRTLLIVQNYYFYLRKRYKTIFATELSSTSTVYEHQ